MSPCIRPLSSHPATVEDLGALLIETVANGGSVSFMHPLAPESARAFWRDALADADRGCRVVLGAYIGGVLAATVTLNLDMMPNQLHRADISKLMTAMAYRGRGLAAAVMAQAERIAAERGRSLLTLDTAVEEGAAGFYEKLGYIRAGVIPDYALKPHGGLVGTAIYYKTIEPESRSGQGEPS